jgi:hypothetical protein
MTTCTRCHRTLRTEGVTRGMGRTCARRVRETAAAAVELIKADTLAKAMEDIEDGALIDTRRTTSAGRPVFAALSSGGVCTCRAGHAGRTCRHMVAATILTAA